MRSIVVRVIVGQQSDDGASGAFYDKIGDQPAHQAPAGKLEYGRRRHDDDVRPEPAASVGRHPIIAIMIDGIHTLLLSNRVSAGVKKNMQ